jgi:RnfABCDGE-type electron transport complex G subunit
VPDWLKFPVVLIVVALVSAVSLTALQGVTEPQRLKIEAKIKAAALKVVLPSAEKFEDAKVEVGGKKFDYLKGLGPQSDVVGYVAEGSAQGYSSIIKVMVGVDQEFKIIAIKVLSQRETPGLGDKINEILSKNTIVGLIRGIKFDETGLRPWFQVQFDGKSAPIKVQKDKGDIEAITGATITSRTVCKAVDQAVANLKSALTSQVSP